jgi:hypothetical protein
MDIAQELAKRLNISEAMAAEQLQRDPSLASLITGRTVPTAIAPAASAEAPAAIDEEEQAKQRGFSTLQDLIKGREAGASPSAKLAEKFPNLSPEARTSLLREKYSLSEMAEPEKTSPSNLLESFKQATEMKEAAVPEQATVTALAPEPEQIPSVSVPPAVKPERAAVKGVPAVGVAPAKEPTLQERISGELSGLKAERAEAKAEREEAMRRTDIGELASMVARSLTQIGAAYQGAKTGQDMSNIAQQTMVNWDKRRDQIFEQYRQTIGELDKQQAGIERQQERLEAAAEKAADRTAQDAYRQQMIGLEKEKIKIDDKKATNAFTIAELKNSAELAKAIADGKTDTVKELTKTYTKSLKDLDDQIESIRKIQGMDLGGKKSKAIAEALVPIFGVEAIEEKGIFWDSVKGKKELKALMEGKLAELQKRREQVNNNLTTGLKASTLMEPGQAAPTEAPVQTPPSQPPATGKVLSSSNVKALAQRDGITEDVARRKLQALGYTIRD